MNDDLVKGRSERAGLTAPGKPYVRGRPVFSWLSVSNYSPVFNDMWIRGWEFKYEIVLLPGYRKPDGLDPYSIDSIWYKGEVTEPTVVWDGTDQVRMFEIISECFDPKAEMSDFIKVRSLVKGAYVEDQRSRRALDLRPSYYIDSDIDILAFERQVARTQHHKDLTKFAMSYGTNTERKAEMEFIHNIYKEMLDEHPSHPKNYRKAFASKHPKIGEPAFFTGRGPRQVVQDLQFGLAFYEAELAKHPKWHLAQIQLDYLIKTKEITDPEHIAAIKRTQKIPLTAEDEDLLNSRNKPVKQKGFLGRMFGV